MGAEVYIYDRAIDRLRELHTLFGGRASTCYASTLEIEQRLPEADLVIGAVLVPGAKAPKLVGNDLVKRMKAGSVLVDIAIDQGGCFEDSRPTTHAEPTFAVHDSVFYCVANMPGAVPNTSTYALTNATLPYALRLADLGWEAALKSDPALTLGLNVHAGQLTNASVGEALGLPSVRF
jgi:alanine dehydrogenase